MKGLLRRIFDFWFAPMPAARLAALRILVGAFALWYLLPRYDMLLSVAGTTPDLFAPVGAASILISPMPVVAFQALLLLTYALSAAFLVGWRHSVTGPAFGLVLWFVLCYRNSWSMIYHSDNLLVLHGLILGFTRSADVWSVDALFRRRGGALDTRAAADPSGDWRYGWPIRLICVVAVCAYFLSGVAKVAGPLGWSWIHGEALRSQLAVDGLRKELLGEGAAPLTFRLYGQVWLFTMIGVITMVLELGAPAALFHRWIGRCWAIGAWLMHWGILFLMDIKFEYSLSGVIFAAFFPLERPVERALRGRGRGGKVEPQRRGEAPGTVEQDPPVGIENCKLTIVNLQFPPPTVVLFDGRCGLCQRSRRIGRALDWLGRVAWLNFRDPAVRAAIPHLRDEQLEAEMWVITPDGEMRAGFEGWRALLARFPLTFVPSLAMYVPPVPWLGRRVYRFVARRRRLVCEVEPQRRGDAEGTVEQEATGRTTSRLKPELHTTPSPKGWEREKCWQETLERARAKGACAG